MNLRVILQEFIEEQCLPEAYIDTALKWFTPIAENIFELHNGAKRPVIIGLNGCQGSGKSTLTALLCKLLNDHYQKTCIGMSIDDFYLSKSARKDLSESVHPLFATRGVPGTHDIDLLNTTLQKLKQQQSVIVSRFDKSIDDLYPVSDWYHINEPVDIVILEGWCVGIEAQADESLIAPVNKLEEEQDPDGAWRRYVNKQLFEKYAIAFNNFDLKIMLKSPSFASVYRWRCEQEHKLIAKLSKSNLHNEAFSGLMSDAQIEEFIQYYQRLTEHALITMPSQCDIVVSLDDSRGITNCLIK